MNIWRRQGDLDQVNAWIAGTMCEHLGMRFTELGEDFLRASMPVDPRTRQPFGLLHGGASVALAETLGSTAANMCCDAQSELAVGLEINANHVRAIADGRVEGVARPLHVGRSTQVWDIRISDGSGELVCIARLTCAVVPRSAGLPTNR